jgi:methylated-DNA-protein-cysteine methyltransferase-like protein
MSQLEHFTERVCEVIAAIPEGKVATYGQIAVMAGNQRSARQVVRILHTLSRSRNLPWHRVVNVKGRISLPVGAGFELQRELLENEGIVFDGRGVIDFAVFRWRGE